MIEYRKASTDDIDELIRLRVEFIKELQKIQDSNNDAQLKESLASYFQTAMDRDEFIAWLAVENGNIVGTSGLCFYTLPPSFKNITGKVAYIMNMYTLPEYRNRKIASRLFEKILEEARNSNCEKVCLHATESGRPLYIKYGFKEATGEMALYLV